MEILPLLRVSTAAITTMGSPNENMMVNVMVSGSKNAGDVGAVPEDVTMPNTESQMSY